MKKAVITVVSAVLIALTATGCGAPAENTESEIVMPAYTSEWPVNEYTEEIRGLRAERFSGYTTIRRTAVLAYRSTALRGRSRSSISDG